MYSVIDKVIVIIIISRAVIVIHDFEAFRFQ